MKRVLIGVLIGLSAVGAQAHAARDFLAVVGAVTLIQQATQPRVIYAPQPQVIYQQTYPQVYPQYEYRTPPVYSNQYPAPTVSCIPAYTQQGQYIGCIR